jgi:aryl-alcohol dehydrogenase-like predicted oxidoreductase
MRYRPFGRSGVATSCISLSLTDNAAGRGVDALRQLIYVGLEAGVNAYHIAALDPEIPAILGQALSVVERRLVFVSLQLGVARGRVGVSRDFSPETLTATVDQVLNASQLGHIDLVVLDDPGMDELPRASLDALKALRASGRVSLLGVSGSNEAMDAYVSTNAFDVLVTPYHLRSGWKERNRLKAAVTLDMGVVAYDFFPEAFSTSAKVESAIAPRPRGLFGGKPANASPLDGVGSYRFLHDTKNWTAEEICLAYCLTEPSLATVLVECDDPEHLAQLAAVPDREMPPGLAAQVEMARFAPMNDQSAAG